MPISKTKLKNAAIAAKSAALPSIPRELIDQFGISQITCRARYPPFTGLRDGRFEGDRGAGLLRLTVENEFDSEMPSAGKHGLGLTNLRGRLNARYENRARLDTGIRGESFLAEVTLPCENELHAPE